jgi:hypothetical protein
MNEQFNSNKTREINNVTFFLSILVSLLQNRALPEAIFFLKNVIVFRYEEKL